MKCNYCDAELDENSRFCDRCGKPAKDFLPATNNNQQGVRTMVAETIYYSPGTSERNVKPGSNCPICGSWVERQASFRCKKCGRDFLCKKHLDPATNICFECAQQELSIFKNSKKTSNGYSGKTERIGSDRLELILVPGVTMEFIQIPAGEFLEGGNDADEGSINNEKLQNRTYLDEFWIGKYPVTNQQYGVYIKATTAIPPRNWSGNEPPKGMEEHPVAYVSWEDAQNFCVWVRGITVYRIRLPSESEWEKAARGTHGRFYPWGNQLPDDQWGNFKGEKNWAGTTPVGKFSPFGDSPYGCADMAGNVWEWVDDWYKDYKTEQMQEYYKHEIPLDLKVLRGGSFAVDVKEVRTTKRHWNNQDTREIDFGFRCVLTI